MSGAMAETPDFINFFLSHSTNDKAAVRSLAERLRQDGLKVWFDELVLKPGNAIPAKIEEGLGRTGRNWKLERSGFANR
jgi:TIR domain-containing protein